MNNQDFVKVLQKTLIDGLAQTENRVMNEIVTLNNEMVTIKNEMITLRTDVTNSNNGITALRSETKQGFEKLINQQVDFETDVSNELLEDKRQVQQEIDFLKQQIQLLEKNFPVCKK